MAEYLYLMSIFSQSWAHSAALRAVAEQVLMYAHGQQRITQKPLTRSMKRAHMLQSLLKVSFSPLF